MKCYFLAVILFLTVSGAGCQVSEAQRGALRAESALVAAQAVKTAADQQLAALATQPATPATTQAAAQLQQISAAAGPVITQAAQAAAGSSQQARTAQTTEEGIVTGVSTLAGLTVLIPGWGGLIAALLGAGVAGYATWRKAQTQAAAESLILSVEAAKAAGLSLSASVIDALNAIQTPEARALVDAIQKRQGVK